jgi:hypothetical protein
VAEHDVFSVKIARIELPVRYVRIQLACKQRVSSRGLAYILACNVMQAFLPLNLHYIAPLIIVPTNRRKT